MAGIRFTTQSIPISDKILNGGLNSTAGPLGLANNESSDLQNIDFNKFGSILKRNGFTALNTATLNSAADSNGLFWFEYYKSGSLIRHAVNLCGNKIYKMDDLDGTWDNITSATAITITTAYHVSGASFQNRLYMTNGYDLPFQWDGANCTGISLAEVPTNLTKAKYVELYNNYLFYGNIVLSTGTHPSRIYWSNLKDPKTWTATDYIDVAQNDGQEIMGFKVLADRLVIFKNRSIYNLYFTGDVDIPFILPGGGKSNSPVGCAAPFSIQEVDNGLVFLSYDGFYFYDGLNSYKISDKINTTIASMDSTKFINSVSLVQKTKNRYWCSVTTSGSSENNRVLVWDYFNNAWSIYKGIDPCSMTTFYVSGTQERPYWGDYRGHVYRSDTGSNDYPMNVSTAIDAYYWTNWKHYEDLVDKKGIAHIIIYHQIASSTLTLSYSYDFDTDSQYSLTVDLSTSADVYGTGKYGTATYAKAGGNLARKDLPLGRGRVVRFKFSNNIAGETFQVDGFGTLPHLETYE